MCIRDRAFAYQDKEVLHHISFSMRPNSMTALVEMCIRDSTDVDAVITDLSVGYIIKAVDEIGNGCLAGTGCANKGNLLPRFCV